MVGVAEFFVVLLWKLSASSLSFSVALKPVKEEAMLLRAVKS